MASATRFPDRHALEVEGTALTYSQLRELACRLAATLQRHDAAATVPLTAVLAQRSVTAFSGILGALLRGHGYVPLHPGFPEDRTLAMLERAGCSSLIVGKEALPALAKLLPRVTRPLLLVLPASSDVAEWQAGYPNHTFLGSQALCPPEEWQPVNVEPQDTAYLLFTSGSTGVPKGVRVTHANISRFIEVVADRYDISAHDRFSQMFELVFDLSLFDMFVAWERGACVCCPDAGAARLPAKFIVDSEITIWFSVPSLAASMKMLRMLEAGLYPGLRLSLFCGEALLADIAAGWAEAAPNSVVENLYGPTEATLACTLYRWDPQHSPAESAHGIVPIGFPFPGMTAIVVDGQLHETAPGEAGELLLGGPQVAAGYWNDPGRTAAAFVTPPGKDALYYRTGDLVRRSRDNDLLHYLGRIDQQIKIRGNRVELGEIEAVLRDAAGVDLAVAVGWPVTPSGADGIVAFLSAGDIGLDVVRATATRRLPGYMMPREFRLLESFPLNANGKVDRKALLDMLGSSA
jgi:amino acid adenylation domain-containing protein